MYNAWSRYNDSVEGTIKWIEKIGIIYIPDYAYPTNKKLKSNLV